MEPTVNEGDSVLVSSIPYFFSAPKIGDIVAFKKENETFIKRITKIKNNEYFLAGDNSKDSINTWVNKEDLIGKVISINTR